MFPIIYSEDFLKHRTGRSHPEKPERLTAIVKALENAPWADSLEWQNPCLNAKKVMAWLEKIHTTTYIEKVRQLAEEGGGWLDPDTPVSPESYEVALLAVSAWLDGVDAVGKTGKPAFVLARPPGHHAERETGMGFCLFSNAAIAAYYALEKNNINRVAILDWDVHHGNGTQAIVENSSHIAYCSLHQSPFYPGTGQADEGGAYHNVLNIPMSCGSTIAEYKPAFKEKVIPFLNQFQPDLLIVSAGYDANEDDMLAGISLQPSDYKILTQYALQVTSRILFGLEGGYDLNALAQSVMATIEGCLIA